MTLSGPNFVPLRGIGGDAVDTAVCTGVPLLNYQEGPISSNKNHRLEWTQ